MFNNPEWASLIDVKAATGVASALSHARLAAYGLEPSMDGDIDAVKPAADLVAAVARHGINMVLCESFYPVLHMMELVLRNRVHEAFSSHFESAQWYEDAWLAASHQRMIEEAKAELQQRGVQLQANRVIAELSFGFWCGMFHARYERGPGPWPALLHSVFPRVPKSWATREKIRTRLESARLLRNRVFHHHPISQYQDLYARHRAMMELLGWMSPEARAHVESICRFNRVHADRLQLTVE
ncbi:hypothetical protein [Stenotrophomonas bentonitica]|uniref:hypothetical protein n=1 Tax=Stenotrophomonas bentonitica TaxID=1450134 RepID=UPI00345E865A